MSATIYTPTFFRTANDDQKIAAVLAAILAVVATALLAVWYIGISQLPISRDLLLVPNAQIVYADDVRTYSTVATVSLPELVEAAHGRPITAFIHSRWSLNKTLGYFDSGSQWFVHYVATVPGATLTATVPIPAIDTPGHTSITSFDPQHRVFKATDGGTSFKLLWVAAIFCLLFIYCLVYIQRKWR